MMASGEYMSKEPPSRDILNSSLTQEHVITYVMQARAMLGKSDLLRQYGHMFKIMRENIKGYTNNSFLVSNVSQQTLVSGYLMATEVKIFSVNSSPNRPHIPRFIMFYGMCEIHFFTNGKFP
jgi:hypothetical protein